MSDEANSPAPRKKQADLQDLGADGLSDSEAADISAGGNIIPCIRPLPCSHSIVPCVKPAIDPCWRPGILPGGHTH